MPMTPAEARAVARPAIEVGESYEFYAEIQEEYRPTAERLRNYTGQRVTVLSERQTEDPDSSRMYHVRAEDGREFDAWEEELNGWDRDLGQFFNADATYGPDRETWPLENEEANDGTR